MGFLVFMGSAFGVIGGLVGIAYLTAWLRQREGDACAFGHKWQSWDHLDGTIELRTLTGELVMTKFKRYSQRHCAGCPQTQLMAHHAFPDNLI